VATATDPLPALTATVKLLDAVKHQLVAAVSANALKNEASEQFNAWQTVTLLTLCAYGALSQRIHTCLLSTPDSASIQELLYSVLGSFVALVKALVLYTERKVPALKLTQVTEFFDTLSAAVQGIQPALQAACSPSSGFGTEAAQLVRLRVTCVNALLKTVRSINAIVLNKVSAADVFNLFFPLYLTDFLLDLCAGWKLQPSGLRARRWRRVRAQTRRRRRVHGTHHAEHHQPRELGRRRFG
jgi:hypothetical protein